VAVDSPSVNNAVHIFLVPRTTDVISDLVSSVFFDRFPHPAGNIIQDFVPRDACPLATTPRAVTFEGILDPLGIVYLVDRRRSLRTIFPSTTRMFGITLDLPDVARFFVDVREQATACLTVEASSRDDRVFAGFTAGFVLNPVMPVFGLWIVREITVFC
jgi:hypothetical protein